MTALGTLRRTLEPTKGLNLRQLLKDSGHGPATGPALAVSQAHVPEATCDPSRVL
jgi:hypothetical protein